MQDSALTQTDRDGHYNTYFSYATILRAWFVAYGIGGPVLFLTQSEIAAAISQSGWATFVIVLFLLGVSFQIVVAIVNKWVNWHLYFDPDPATSTRPKLRAWAYAMSNKFWFDVVCDVGSVVAFGLATLTVLLIFS